MISTSLNYKNLISNFPFIFSVKSRKSSITMSVTSDKIQCDSKKLKDSPEGDDEMGIYIVTHEDDKFTEIDFGKEIPFRKEFPMLLNIGDDKNSFLEMSRKDINQLKLSTHNIEKLEKIIQQSDDDKIANVLNVIEELNKTLWGLRETRGREGNVKSKDKMRMFQEAEVKNIKGISLEIGKSNRIDNTEFVRLFDDLREFGLVLKK